MKRKLNGKKYLIAGAVILAAGFLFGPLAVKAATTIYLHSENQAVSEGDTFLVNLNISTPDKSINAIDGTVIYDNNKLEIKELSTGGSLFTLWPKPPVFSNDKGDLSFVGGVPGGFQGGERKVLKIIFLAKNKGEARIDFLDGFSVFLNDEQGTLLNPWLRPLSLNIAKRLADKPPKDEWKEELEKDTTPPEFFEVVVNRHSSIFENKYFVSFYAVDKDSGIDYYEVKEGNDDYVQIQSPYVLKDQSLKNAIQVKAVDKAGNEKIVEIKPSISPLLKWVFLIIIIAIILSVIVLIIFWRRRNKKK